jgi:hypothetical protein
MTTRSFVTFRSLVLGTAAIGLAGASVSSANAAEMEKKFAVSGFVNRVLSVTGDGDTSYVDFGDNAADGSRFRLTGTSTGGGMTVGAEIELGLNRNQNQDQSQNSSNTTSNGLTQRKAYVWAESEKYGTLTFGYASTASDGITEVDLAGTESASYNGSWGPSSDYYFLQSNQKGGTTAGSTAAGAANPAIGSLFDNFSGNGRQDLIRYDTPDFKGFVLGVSASQGGAFDGSINYSGKFYNTEVAAAAGFVNSEATGDSKSYGASVSALHASGLNATLAWGKSKNAGRQDSKNFYTKLGYQMKLNSFGPTNVSASWERADNLAADTDSAKTWGLQLVQGLEGYGTELYAAYSNFKLDRTGTNYNNINAGWVGAIVKF